MATIYIDNVPYEVKDGENLLQACLSVGKNLTYFCWHPALHSVGACRQCAVIRYRDENDTRGRIVMACMEPVADQARISIDAPEAKKFRAQNIESLMINHPHDCPVCDEGGECHLQDMTVMSGHNYRRYRFKKRTYLNQYLGPFLHHEMNRCIQCYRCVRFYNDYAEGKDFGVFAAHDDVYFGRYEPGVLENEFSGNLVEVCPTGVFTDKTLRKHYTRKWDLTNAPSICHQCGLGCNIIASERYGSLRRILNRYNGDVNGYFLCDRGRFGYEYVNSQRRIRHALQQQPAGQWQGLKKETAIREIRDRIRAARRVIGIGSPRASLESNFLLRELVGASGFYAGVSEQESRLIKEVLHILRHSGVHTPSLKETETYDAIFVIGEDVTNTAPRLALSLRQAAKNQPKEKAKALKIAYWNDAAIREVIQGQKGPLFIAAPYATRLDDAALATYQAHPDEIARLAFAVAHQVDAAAAGAELPEMAQAFARQVADALVAAKKPLIVAGTSLYSQSLIHAAANVAMALKKAGKEAGLTYTVPEVNSMGLVMMTDQYLEQAFEQVYAGQADMVIVVENDLYRRLPVDKVDAFFRKAGTVVVLDSIAHRTGEHAHFVLPAGTFAESSGTVVNNEGRAQRFFQVYQPAHDICSSWKWLQAFVENEQLAAANLDGVIQQLIMAYPELEGIREAAPGAQFRVGTQKIPREPHRYSGRTAMLAHINVSEPKPPEDPDSPLSFTMEGYLGTPPAPLTPFFWSPGWNSVQAVSRYQQEVGGALLGGNPGKRLIEANGSSLQYFTDVPAAFHKDNLHWNIVPAYHIFGSDELSALSEPLQERMPALYLALSPADAQALQFQPGQQAELNVYGQTLRLPVTIKPDLPGGYVLVPKGWEATAGWLFPVQSSLKPVQV
ncbi:NADH dehydrogenase subunit G [Thermoflavifilum aggregans]|uniref:NADH-quinone oxidoreductase n=1 Tax=Thermoflavifilum aggregans TaxID=454188 RepID=A0A2M9CSY5_9BACT|nr:NADH-quinone oxidoreductase subunit NuoG [Thermoflavifilum aggregans]PJJ74965.1 NADH dehydrogenase subunit G [Thermoflavifilum aggregans]